MSTNIEIIEKDEQKPSLGGFDNPTAAGLAIMQASDASAQKTLLSLNNVDNTSDAGKPVSTATQTALDLKANTADVPAARTFVALTETATLTANADHTINLSTADAVLTLPAAATSIGKDVCVINISSSANVATVIGAGGAKVLFSATGYALPAGQGGRGMAFVFCTNGTDWFLK